MRINENSPRKWPNSHSQKSLKILMPPPPPIIKVLYTEGQFMGEGTPSMTKSLGINGQNGHPFSVKIENKYT